MSNSSKTIIKYFCDRFLNLEYYPENIKTILDLPLDKLKDTKKEEISILNNININTIRDFASIDMSIYDTLLESSTLTENTLKKLYIASKLIANAWGKRTTYLKKPQMKVIVAGLDYAGKTSLINRLMNDYNYNDVINLEPTVGVNVEEFKSERLNLILWDLGGQKNHIDEYLEEPERFFIQMDVLIFVIDSQDDVRYDIAIKYLNDLIEILGYLDEFPFILVLLNKADTDIINDPDYQIKLEYITEKVTDLFIEHEKSWIVEIIPTSIYNFYSNTPEIAKNIKNIFSKDISQQKDDKLPEIEKKVQKILDINLQFMDKISADLAEIKKIMFRTLPTAISGSLFEVPFQKVSFEEQPEKKKKKKKLKPSKKTSIPQVIPSIKLPQKTQTTLLDQIKNVQLKPPAISSDPNNPPMAPPKTQRIEGLNPPPKSTEKLTSKLESSQESNQEPPINRAQTRQQIISELKDLFVKRGIVG
ncbi:MAG: 50S ribosome-binding GTPase [Candidatus Lokiarchaeota archaeon]|nr:50S ribosome-binding GTPase [Candidatus Lokiarchaeota archaeon]